jgi:hypothetical protein
MLVANLRGFKSGIALLSAMFLASCIGGPVSDAEPEGALSCEAPLAKDEAVLLKGSKCLGELLPQTDKPPQILTDSEVSSISFPWVKELEKIREGYKFTPKDTDLSILEFLDKEKAQNVVKEYNIRYLVYSTSATQEEPMPEPYSKEDFQGAIISSREKTSYVSALVVDAQESKIVGSLYQYSEGRIRIVPLLVIFSTPDTLHSACSEIADALTDLFAGDCSAFSLGE